VTAPGERLTPQQSRDEYERCRQAWSTASALEAFERALVAWQADREALEEVSRQKKVAEFALGFPILAPHIKRSETVDAENKALRALLRRAREALADCEDALTKTITSEFQTLRNPDPASHDSSVIHAREVLAELDAAQGETK